MSWIGVVLSMLVGTSALGALFLWHRSKSLQGSRSLQSSEPLPVSDTQRLSQMQHASQPPNRLNTSPQPPTQSPDATISNRLAVEILDVHRRHQRRMSSDLHDGVSQNLAGISLLLESLAGQLRKESTKAAEKLDRIAELVHNTSALAEDRVLSHKIEQEEAATEGLRAGLERLAENIEIFFAVESKVTGEISQSVAGTLAGHLYRIAEEAAYNAVRHGRPSRVSFELADDAGRAVMHIDDDGCGITDVRDPKGRGLHLMALRCKIIGAELHVGPRESGGTRVTCRWPSGKKVM